jgi:sugar phosphate isomerase/epimerase
MKEENTGMQMLSRRGFIGAGSMGLAAAAGLKANPLGMPVGCQLYPVAKMITADFEGTLKQLSGMGYQMVEMCSPPGYEKSGFGSLVGLKAADVRKKIQDAGLGCISCHYQFREMKESLPERIAYAKELGLTQMILSSFGLPATATMADWARAAGELNKIGEETRKAGLQAGFHNHHNEFKEIDGVLIYDKLMGEFDPNLVKMQFQVAVVSVGYQAATYFTKYPGRFISMHLADWSATEKKPVPVGEGVVDWKKLFIAAKEGGVKNYFVEMNLEAMKASSAYLHGLAV